MDQQEASAPGDHVRVRVVLAIGDDRNTGEAKRGIEVRTVGTQPRVKDEPGQGCEERRKQIDHPRNSTPTRLALSKPALNMN